MIKKWLLKLLKLGVDEAQDVAGDIYNDLKPALIEAVVKAAKEEIRENVPVIVRAVVAAVAETAGQVVVNTGDRITDMIPGDLDDKVYDQLVENVFGRLDQLGFKLPR